MPQRGPKHAFLELVEKNAQHSFEQRFRVLKPSSKAIVEALESALSLPEPPKRIESFDISHIQGSDTVASMVVWEDGRMKKSDYRKFIIRGEHAGAEKSGRATISPACAKPWSAATAACKQEKKPLPSLILIDGGIGQLHAAAEALEKLEIINQPVASIAKKEEILYVLGQEDEPIRPGTTFADPASDPADSRRNASLRRHLSPPAPRQPHACARTSTKFPASARAPRKNCCDTSAASRSCANSLSISWRPKFPAPKRSASSKHYEMRRHPERRSSLRVGRASPERRPNFPAARQTESPPHLSL